LGIFGFLCVQYGPAAVQVSRETSFLTTIIGSRGFRWCYPRRLEALPTGWDCRISLEIANVGDPTFRLICMQLDVCRFTKSTSLAVSIESHLWRVCVCRSHLLLFSNRIEADHCKLDDSLFSCDLRYPLRVRP
jgi:hypothetical protein